MLTMIWPLSQVFNFFYTALDTLLNLRGSAPLLRNVLHTENIEYEKLSVEF